MNSGGARVLLADPDTAHREQLYQQLAGAGFQIQLAQTGTEVVYACNVEPPDVLVLDTHLPDMDGFEVCQHVRRETRETDLAVVFITNAESELERTCLGKMVEFAGGDYFLTKPCDARLLVQLIEDLVGRSADRLTRERRPGPVTRVVWPTARVPVPTA